LVGSRSSSFPAHTASHGDDLGNRLGVGPGEDHGPADPDREDQDGADQPLQKVRPGHLGEIIENHADQDVSAPLIPDHDRQEQIGGPLARTPDRFLPEARRDEDIQLGIDAHAHWARV
jgi:hypothetical protein